MDLKPEINHDELDFYLNHQLNVSDYTQNWSAYNKSQRNEFRIVQEILIELLDSLIISKKFRRPGRPFLDLKEMIYCCVMRAFIGKSSRRGASFLEYAVLKGYISKIPHHNTILNYYKEEAMTDILKFLVEKSATPLKNLELDFTVDASGFSTSLFGRWLTVRNETKKDKRIYKKAHITSGVISNIITAIEVTPGYFADSPQFKKLLKITAETFEVREVSADKAYSSRKNLQAVAELGGIPYIAFKENAKATPRGSLVWNRMKKFYDKYREYFMMHYHKRSNAETVFSMIKRKFGNHLYSKSDVGQTNEILCKALAHNICVLIQEYHENSIKLNFNYCAKMVVKR
jgi:transposase